MPRQRKDFLLNPIVIIIIIIIALIAAFNFYQNRYRMRELENQIENIETQIAEAENENEKLNTQIEDSKNHEYIEEVAREKLGLVKPGEMLLLPIEEEDEDPDDE